MWKLGSVRSCLYLSRGSPGYLLNSKFTAFRYYWSRAESSRVEISTWCRNIFNKYNDLWAYSNNSRANNEFKYMVYIENVYLCGSSNLSPILQCFVGRFQWNVSLSSNRSVFRNILNRRRKAKRIKTSRMFHQPLFLSMFFVVMQIVQGQRGSNIIRICAEPNKDLPRIHHYPTSSTHPSPPQPLWRHTEEDRKKSSFFLSE